MKRSGSFILIFFICLFFCSAFLAEARASERLEDFSDLVKSIDAEAEKPSGKTTEKPSDKTTEKPSGKTTEKPSGKTAGKTESVKPSLSVNSKKTLSDNKKSSISAEDRDLENDFTSDYNRGSDDDFPSDDDRLREFARLAEKTGEGFDPPEEIKDDRLLSFAKETDRLEKKYEEKYGAVIEDNVVTDPSKYNDGDRVTVTAKSESFKESRSDSTVKKSNYKPTGVFKKTESLQDGENSEYISKSTERFLRNVFSSEIEEPLREDKVESVFYDKENLGVFTLMAYDACIECCGKTDGITATGVKAQVGRTIAVDPVVIPYGSKVMIDGHVYVAEDAGSDIRGNSIDIFMNTHEEAKQFGRKTAEVFLVR